MPFAYRISNTWQPMLPFEYVRRHLNKEDLATRFDPLVREMAQAGWELAAIKPTYGYVRTFWEQEGRGPFQGSYLVFRRPRPQSQETS